jgi:hypothetical protein
MQHHPYPAFRAGLDFRLRHEKYKATVGMNEAEPSILIAVAKPSRRNTNEPLQLMSTLATLS